MINEEDKYQKALERAKKELDTCGSKDCDAARQIFRLFPELKESEDERIRKHLISRIRDLGFGDDLFDAINTKGDILSWLEKQGEQKPTWSEEDEKEVNILETYIRNRDWSDSHVNKALNILKELVNRLRKK